MGKRQFEIELYVTATVEIDDAVIAAVDDEWRSVFYNLRTPEQIAGMIGYNLAARPRIGLSNLDGWADQPDDNARLVGYPEWETEEVREI